MDWEGREKLTIAVKFKDGLLKIKIPKPEDHQPKLLNIKLDNIVNF